jgi:hypothetical protein
MKKVFEKYDGFHLYEHMYYYLLLLLFVGWDWVPRYLLKSLGI